MAGDASEHDEASSGDSTPTLTIGKQRYCPHCNYDLRGQPVNGKCPECGSVYSQASALRYPRPGPLKLLALYGWPVPAMILLAIVAEMSQSDYPGLAAMVVVFFLGLPALVLNGIIVTVVHSVRQRRRYGFPPDDAGMPLRLCLGRIGLVLFVLFTIVPAIAVGGCLILIVSAS